MSQRLPLLSLSLFPLSLLPVYSKTLDQLMEESGCALEHSDAARFRSHVIEGEWDQVSDSVAFMRVHMFPWHHALAYQYSVQIRRHL